MGWYKQACSCCWDNHDGMTCEEYAEKRAQWQATHEAARRAQETNELLREQNALLRTIAERKAK